MAETALARIDEQHTGLATIVDRAREYIGKAKAPNTLRAYRNDWQDFCGWCEAHAQCSLLASVEYVVLYLTDRAETCKISMLMLITKKGASAWRLLGCERVAGSASPWGKALPLASLPGVFYTSQHRPYREGCRDPPRLIRAVQSLVPVVLGDRSPDRPIERSLGCLVQAVSDDPPDSRVRDTVDLVHSDLHPIEGPLPESVPV